LTPAAVSAPPRPTDGGDVGARKRQEQERHTTAANIKALFVPRATSPDAVVGVDHTAPEVVAPSVSATSLGSEPMAPPPDEPEHPPAEDNASGVEVPLSQPGSAPASPHSTPTSPADLPFAQLERDLDGDPYVDVDDLDDEVVASAMASLCKREEPTIDSTAGGAKREDTPAQAVQPVSEFDDPEWRLSPAGKAAYARFGRALTSTVNPPPPEVVTSFAAGNKGELFKLWLTKGGVSTLDLALAWG
jgi:hypothetical protein